MWLWTPIPPTVEGYWIPTQTCVLHHTKASYQKDWIPNCRDQTSNNNKHTSRCPAVHWIRSNWIPGHRYQLASTIQSCLCCGNAFCASYRENSWAWGATPDAVELMFARWTPPVQCGEPSSSSQLLAGRKQKESGLRGAGWSSTLHRRRSPSHLRFSVSGVTPCPTFHTYMGGWLATHFLFNPNWMVYSDCTQVFNCKQTSGAGFQDPVSLVQGSDGSSPDLPTGVQPLLVVSPG